MSVQTLAVYTQNAEMLLYSMAYQTQVIQYSVYLVQLEEMTEKDLGKHLRSG